MWFSPRIQGMLKFGVRPCIHGTHSATNPLKQGWITKVLNCQILVDPQEIGTLQLCSSFYSPLCWEVKWNYLGGSSCRNWAKLGCVPGILSGTRSDRVVLGLAQGRHNYSSSTCRRLPGELSSWNWAGQRLPQVSNICLCNPFSLILCVGTPLRTFHLTIGGVAGCLWLWIINVQAESIDKPQGTWLFTVPQFAKPPTYGAERSNCSPTAAAAVPHKLPHCSAICRAVEYLQEEHWNGLCDGHEFD